jgi:predicted nucleic acid-binding protein
MTVPALFYFRQTPACETSALAIMLGSLGAIFLTDDTAARLAAESLGVAVHGTIGILLRAIRRNQRSVIEVLEVLRQLPERSTLHVAPRLLAVVVAEVEQHPRNVSIHN